MSEDKVNKTQTEIDRVFQTRPETKAYYNKISKVYDLLAEHSEGPVRKAALDLLAPQSGESILEIGFGTGHCLVDLALAVGKTGHVYGIDLSDEMLRIAKKLLAKKNLLSRTELQCGDATALPFADNFFDALFMSFTLELFDTPEIPMVLDECRRVLRPGGRIVAASISKEQHDGFILKAYEWTHQHFPNFLDCRPIFVGRAFEEAGFGVEVQEFQKMWVPVEIVLAVKDG